MIPRFVELSWEQALNKVLSDPATRIQLAHRLREDANRDPVDVLNDAEIALEIARKRAETARGYKPEE